MKTFRLSRRQKNAAKLAIMGAIGFYLLAFAAIDPLAALSTLTLGVGIVVGASQYGESNQQTDSEIVQAFRAIQGEWQTLKGKERFRPLSATELNQVDYLSRQMEQFQTEHEDVLSKSQGRQSDPDSGSPLGQSLGGIRSRRDIASDPSRLRFRDVATGQMMAALEPNERVYQGEMPCSAGDILQAFVTRQSHHVSHDGQDFVQAALGESSIAGGGALLGGPTMSGILVDLARSATVISRAGARTIPMTSASMRVARVTGDVTAHWRGEGQSVDSSGPTFGTYLVNPYFIAAICPITQELFEDTDNAGAIIESTMANAFAVAIDSVALRGEGIGAAPTGIKGTTGVQTITAVGTPTDYSDPTSATRKILDANYQGEISNLSWIRNPKTGEAYDGLVDTTGQPLRPTPWASQLRTLHTTSIPATLGTGSDESEMYFGDFSQVVMFIRKQMTLELMREGVVVNSVAGNDNLTSEFKLAIRAGMRLDVVCLRPDWFVMADGVTAS